MTKDKQDNLKYESDRQWQHHASVHAYSRVKYTHARYSKVEQSEAEGVTPCELHGGGRAAGEGEGEGGGGGSVLYVPVFECLKIRSP